MKESLQNGFAQGSALILTFIPKILFFGCVLLVGYFVAKLVCKGLSAVLARIGFDRVVERGGIKRALDRAGWDASSFLAKVVFYLVMLFVLQIAFGVFGTNPVTQLLTSIIAFLPNVFAAVILVVFGAAAASIVKQLIQVALGALSYGSVVGTVASAAILVVTVTAALNEWNIAPAVVNGLFYALLAAVAGSAIVAVGGAGIQPLRKRWEAALSKMEEEAPKIQEELASASPRVERKTTELKEKARGKSNSKGTDRGADPSLGEPSPA